MLPFFLLRAGNTTVRSIYYNYRGLQYPMNMQRCYLITQPIMIRIYLLN